MSHNGLPTQDPNSHGLPERKVSAAVPGEAQGSETGSLSPYSDLQSAARFPIKLPLSLKSDSGESHTETQNISANGVLFQVDTEMPIGSSVDFTISLPAGILGGDVDVQLDCHGRVVRTFEEGPRKGVGVVIDEYYFDRRT
jgi:hypothetical protein